MAATRSPIALLATFGMLVAPLGSGAEELEPTPEARRAPAAEILDVPEDDTGWLSTQLDRVKLHKKYGLTYTHALGHGGKGVVLKLRGPVLGKALSKRRKLGLAFEIHF